MSNSIVVDRSAGVSPALLALPRQYAGDVSRVLIPHGLVRDRIAKLARDVIEDSDGPLVAVCVLKGGHSFYADLIGVIATLNADRERPVAVQVEFVRLQSYVNDRSTGDVAVTGADLAHLRGKDVLVVEDIIDTGRSAVALIAKLRALEPRRIRFASLLVKDTPQSNGFKPDYAGFTIPDEFVVGYCLDYNEHFRDLQHICVISEQGRLKYAK